MSGDETNPREAEIGRILNDYLDRKGRGEAVSEQEFLLAHPDLATDLRSHFDLVREMAPVLAGGTSDGDDGQMAIPHDSLPGYEILSEIHRGGQGVVYQAYQKSTRRKVAVKVMRAGAFAGRRDRARFEREVQILGSLRHPHIVSIHDSGVAGGSHFFVMDYVPGQPLDLWTSSGPRSVQQILNLFVKICDAVNAAHLRGIVHRDLKPSNVRISSDGEPHILDFGLAKLADAVDPDGPTMTTTGQFVGSLPWASPEQAQGEIDQVDTRTDVYALGVVLYQLLTGRFPYEVVGSMRDVLNRIVSEEPARPSTIRAKVDNEVETIVLKCLAKEPARRYQTAGELGRDIERYLRGEPITAKSDSGMYVLKKLLRRHRAVVAACLSFVLLLSVSLIGSTVLWRDAATARDRAVEAEQRERLERSRADAQALEAQQARKVAEQRADELDRTAYVHQIALAQNACEKDQLARALQILDGCSPEFRGWEWHHLRRRATRSPLLEISAHGVAVNASALSLDGRLVVTGANDGTVRVWDMASRQRLSEFVRPLEPVTSVAFAPDGSRFAVGGRLGTISCHDTRTGEVLWSHHVARSASDDGIASIPGLSFGSGGEELIACSSRGRLIWFESGTGAVRSSQLIEQSSARKVHNITCLALSLDGRLLACGERKSQIEGVSRVFLLDPSDGRLIREIPTQRAGVLCLALSADGKRLVCGGTTPSTRGDAQDTIQVLDVATGDVLVSTSGHEGEVQGVAFSPDGSLLASTGRPKQTYSDSPDHTLKIWNVQTGELLSTLSAHVAGGGTVAWMPDAKRLVTTGQDGRLKVWSRQVTEACLVLRGHLGMVRHVAFSPDGSRLASVGVQSTFDSTDGRSPDNSIRIWDVRTGELLHTLNTQRQAFGVAWVPDGTAIAAGFEDCIRIWECGTETERAAIRTDQGLAYEVDYSPDGRLLAAAFRESCCIWDATTRQRRYKLKTDEKVVNVRFSPNGKLLAASELNGNISLIDPATGTVNGVLRTNVRPNTIVFSHDSRRLVCGQSNGGIGLWDVQSGERLWLVQPNRGRTIQAISFSPEGNRFATVGNDMLLRLWDADFGREMLAFQAHEKPAMGVHFSPDGKRIATCGMDSLAKVWDASVQPAESNVASQPVAGGSAPVD